MNLYEPPCVCLGSKLVAKFQSKARALKQTQASLGELQASMRGLKEQLQLLHQV